MEKAIKVRDKKATRDDDDNDDDDDDDYVPGCPHVIGRRWFEVNDTTD
jgi:hypothetical protein